MNNADSKAWDLVLSIKPDDLIEFYEETEELSDLHRHIYQNFQMNGRFSCAHQEFFFYSNAAELYAISLHAQESIEP
ncbi:hypothetical protein [Ruegeria atlantica]|uniref:Uncharacterized protein n=1 Tax=Ruegeria atlantica TaxID=81569 RepID=A0A0P1EFD5_9RHOB|nr:hypothetical protein [Ruegeria atlantica]CUH48746.1 hypothetical protein RUA4292_02935 [Ruegeria atlantica]